MIFPTKSLSNYKPPSKLDFPKRIYTIFPAIYIYMYVCMYVCMCVCVCMYVCMHACMYVCMCVCVYACMYVCMHVCMHACMHACMHVCMYVCMYINNIIYIYILYYIYIYIYIIIYTYNPQKKKKNIPASHVTLITIVSILPDSSKALNAERLTRPTVSRPNTAMGSSELKPQATTVQVGSDSPWLSRLSSLFPWKST